MSLRKVTRPPIKSSRPGLASMKKPGMKITPVAKVTPEVKQMKGNSDDLTSEISRTCAVLGCEDGRLLGDDSLHSFPEDPSIRQIWTEMTGRTNWTPNDFSYICSSHFADDSFTALSDTKIFLDHNAIPTLKLPNHVMEVEYVDEDTLDEDAIEKDYENTKYEDSFDSYSENEEGEVSNYYSSATKKATNGTPKYQPSKPESSLTGKSVSKEQQNIQLLKLFTEVQTKQRKVVGLKDRLKYDIRLSNRQKRAIESLKATIACKKTVLAQRKKETKLGPSFEKKLTERDNDLILAMPTRYTDDAKNFALSVYKYSPQAYVYLRNSLRTMLPSTEVLRGWVDGGYEPRNIMSSANTIKVISEVSEKELTCKIFLH